jgi:hypothetical protein
MSVLPEGTILAHFSESNDYGALISAVRGEKILTIWLPAPPCGLSFDENHRIAARTDLDLSYHWEFLPDLRLALEWTGGADETATFPVIVIQDAGGEFFNEIRLLSDCERRFYRKTDWFFGKRPADLWKYLIWGSIYDPRSSSRIDKRFKCQQCAYAWWSYFGFLFKKTGKKNL